MATLLINKPFFFAVSKSASSSLLKSKNGLLPAYENIKSYDQFLKACSFLGKLTDSFRHTYPELEENIKDQEMKQLCTQFFTNLSLETPEWEERFKEIRDTTEDLALPLFSPIMRLFREQYSDRRWECLRDCGIGLLKEDICTLDDLIEILSHKDPAEGRCNLQYLYINSSEIKDSKFSKSCLIKLLAQRDNITVQVFIEKGQELVKRGYDKHVLEQSVIEHLASNPGSSYEEGSSDEEGRRRQLCGGLNDLVMYGDALEKTDGLNKNAQLKLLSRPDCARFLSEEFFS